MDIVTLIFLIGFMTMSQKYEKKVLEYRNMFQLVKISKGSFHEKHLNFNLVIYVVFVASQSYSFDIYLDFLNSSFFTNHNQCHGVLLCEILI